MKAALPFAALMLSACVTVPSQGPTRATVRLGEAARLGPLGIRALSVVEDSRCPALVRCVWQGRLVVRVMADDPVALRRQGGPDAPATAVAQEVDLTLGDPAKPVLGHRIALIEAAPGKAADQPIRPQDYRFTFSLDGGS